jgi:ferric enterobactin receptor
MKRAMSAVLGFLLTTGALEAQQPPAGPPPAEGEIRGVIVEANGSSPVTRASVAVRSRRDSALVTGAIAGDNGAFVVRGLRPGAYYLRITSIGFSPISHNVDITPAEPRVNAGTLQLSRFAVELQQVDVVTEAAAVTIEPDRNSYRARDVAPAAANASEVLSQTPSVEVDPDGKVSLRGNENVAIQINGRPAPIRGEQLGAYLKQLPANVLDRVEVIPTPSARYDPEGMAGIINIVLQQNVDLGRSGGFTLAASPQQRYNLSANFGQQTGPWTLFSTYGFNADQRSVVGLNERERYNSLNQPISFSTQGVSGENENAGHNFNANVEYKFSPRSSLTNILALNRRSSSDDSDNLHTELNADRTTSDVYRRLRNSDVHGRMIDYTTSFRRVVEPRRNELTAELRYNRQSEDDEALIYRRPVSADGRSELESFTTDARTQTVNAQLDHTRAFGQTSKIELGYKGTGRFLDRDYTVMRDPDNSGSWQSSSLSNSFEFNEQVHAAYGVLSHGIGKWELQAGLRAEYADRDFTLGSDNYPFSYTSLFPSGIANYKISDQSGIRLAYSKRIRRPGTQELNPFPFFFDASMVFIGNPRLNPEYTDAYEVSYNRSFRLGTMQVSPFYRRTTDVIRFIVAPVDTIDGREVTSVSFENLATGNSWGTDVNGSLRLGPKLNAFAGFNLFKMVTEGTTGSAMSLASNAVNWSARINATTTLRQGLTLQGFYMYRAPMEFERGKFSRFQMSSFTLRQAVSPKSSVALRAMDPFNTMRFRAEVNDGSVLATTERSFNARSVHLTYQMSFGQAPRMRPRPQEPQQDQPMGFPGS